MLRISTKKTLRWLVLPHGVKVEVRPVTTPVNEAALAEARKRTAALIAEAEAAEKLGQPLDPLAQNGANAAWMEGQRTTFYIEALARYGINRWEGLADDNGDPLPVNPATVAAMVEHPELGVAFLTAYSKPIAEQVAEGNGSASGSDGSSPEVKTDAPDAPAAPAGRTGRKAPAAEPAPAS